MEVVKMKKSDVNKLDDDSLEFVSGGVSAIDGYSYYVEKVDENWIFKYVVKRGDGTTMSKHLTKALADLAMPSYVRDEFEHTTDRYQKLNDVVREKLKERL